MSNITELLDMQNVMINSLHTNIVRLISRLDPVVKRDVFDDQVALIELECNSQYGEKIKINNTTIIYLDSLIENVINELDFSNESNKSHEPAKAAIKLEKYS